MFLVCLLPSCSKVTYYQICKVSSELPTTSKGNYMSENESCKITYDFWDKGGSIFFYIHNKTDEIVYVDLTKSFLIKNGIAYDYFKNRTTATTVTHNVSNGSSVKSTSLGYWNYYGLNVPGSVSVSKEKTAETQKSSTIKYGEKSVIAIPPHSAKTLYEYNIMKNHYSDCDFEDTPSKKKRPIMNFTSSNSPVRFTNFICFRVGENGEDEVVQDSFYVSEVVNKHEKAATTNVEEGCDNDLYKTYRKVFIDSDPKGFYIEYTPRQNSIK